MAMSESGMSKAKNMRRVAPLLVSMVLASVSIPGWAQVGEYELKAAFIGKFTHFVRWPARPAQVFRLCTIGDNPFQGALEDLVKLTPIDGRSAVFVDIHQPEEVKACDMLFISTSEQHNLAHIRRNLGNSPVLTVADTPGFAEQGVMINFVHQGGKVRFEINPQAARAAGLQISARLLKLAIVVPPEAQARNGVAP